MTTYREFYRRSIEQPEAFWGEQAGLIDWHKPFAKVLDYSRPVRVHFVTLLPKTRSGKVLRRSIQALAEGRDPGDLTTLDDPAGIEPVRAAVASARTK